MEEKYKTSANSDETKDGEVPVAQDYVAPGVPIVRTSTPRPLPFLLPAKTELPLAPQGTRVDFPAEAPDAPPLPEEPAREARAESEQPPAQTPRSEAETPDAELASCSPVSEFIWLFEYALDMDPVRLNRPERLNGSAFAYGPAMLRGYRLAFVGLDARTGQVIASLEEARDQPEAEAWGILYRVPRRYTKGEAGEMPLLDKVHLAETFVPLEIQVREPYRQREVTCVTYIASETTRQRVGQLPPEERLPEPIYYQRLLQVARRQKLPMSYLRTLEELVPPTIPAASPLPTTPPEPDTEPLAALVMDRDLHRISEPPQTGTPTTWIERRSGLWNESYSVELERWLMVFGLYLSLLLLGTLVLAIFQGLGFWREVFNDAFTPLGIPWYVLLYGLLGGCVSCIISLGRSARTYPPTFVVLIWFSRPFLGAVLGALAYLVLSSGAILVSAQPAQHFALCSIVGALAGLCEGKLLLHFSLKTL